MTHKEGLFQDELPSRSSKISFRETEEIQEYEKELAIENDTKLKQHDTKTKRTSYISLKSQKISAIQHIAKSISQTFQSNQ